MGSEIKMANVISHTFCFPTCYDVFDHHSIIAWRAAVLSFQSHDIKTVTASLLELTARYHEFYFFAVLLGMFPRSTLRTLRTKFLTLFVSLAFTCVAGLPSVRSATSFCTDGCSAALSSSFPMAAPIIRVPGSLCADLLGFLIPPMAISFSVSLSFLAPCAKWGVWNSPPQRRGSE